MMPLHLGSHTSRTFAKSRVGFCQALARLFELHVGFPLHAYVFLHQVQGETLFCLTHNIT